MRVFCRACASLSSLEGWVPAAVHERSQIRHVFHASAPANIGERWDVPLAEGMHTFRCFWVPLHDAGLISLQQAWVDRALELLAAREA